MMSLLDSSPVTPFVLPADQPTLDQAQLAAAAFLDVYRISPGTRPASDM